MQTEALEHCADRRGRHLELGSDLGCGPAQSAELFDERLDLGRGRREGLFRTGAGQSDLGRGRGFGRARTVLGAGVTPKHIEHDERHGERGPRERERSGQMPHSQVAAGLRAATGTDVVDGEELPTGGDVIVAFEGLNGRDLSSGWN